MKKCLDYLLSSLFWLYYGLTLGLFHPIQVVTDFIGGDGWRRRSVDVMNYLLVKGLHILGCGIEFKGSENIPDNRPIIIVSNHQSLFDIPAVGYGFRKSYPKFISKIELSKNLPSISYNLKHGQSALIDRANGSQAVKEIFKLGRLIEANNYSACIFPEGTRSKDGQVKKFMSAGVNTLLRAAPSAVVIPFVIDGHSHLMQNGNFPLSAGHKITYTALDAIEPQDLSADEVVAIVEKAIMGALNQPVRD